MDVNGIGSVQSAFPVSRFSDISPDAVRNASSGVPRISTNDQVEISATGRLLSETVNSSPARAEKLAHIQRAIDEGTYDTPAKLNIALERMLAQVGFE